MRQVTEKLAVEGGTPVRSQLLPYGHQDVTADDLVAVEEVLRSDWLTTGPKVDEFENAFAAFVGARHAVAVSSGTAALHTAMYAIAVGPGDEAIVPTMTFAASANAVVFQGGTPVFADVLPDSLLLDVRDAEKKITPRTKAIVSVDYAGHACDYDRLRALCERSGLALIADACHAVGGSYKGCSVGTLAHLSTFSFHPVKHITTGEGGMITTDDPELARRMRLFRNHGITTDHRQRRERGSWFYEMVDLGYNYRLTDFQCALGVSQLRKIPEWLAQRRAIAERYDRAFALDRSVRPLLVSSDVKHAYHLYVVRLTTPPEKRGEIFAALRAEGIGVNVHYVPVHLHPYYRSRFGTGPGLCPIAENAYQEILTLPLFSAMTDRDVSDVIEAVLKVTHHYDSEARH